MSRGTSLRRAAAAVVASALALGGVAVAGTSSHAQQRDDVEPYLQITELGIHNGQSGKFVEIHNASDHDISLATVELRYLWGHDALGSHGTMTFPQDAVLPAGEVVVAADPGVDHEHLNELFGTSLNEDDVLPVLSAGLAYNPRGLALYEQTTEQVVSAALYTTAEAGQSQEYRYTGEKDPAGVPLMDTDGTFGTPTPGTLTDGQAPGSPRAVPAELTAPVITHTPPAALAADDARITVGSHVVAARDASEPVTVTLDYTAGDTTASVELALAEGSQDSPLLPASFEHLIPAAELAGASQVSYTLTARSGDAVTRAPAGEESYVVGVTHDDAPVAEPGPYLQITELGVHNGATGKFVEIYNASGHDLNLSSVEVRYLWTHDALGNHEAMALPPNTILPAGETLVVIDPRADHDHLNELFGSSLDRDSVAPVLSAGLAYAERGIALYEATTDQVVSAAFYSTAQAGQSQAYRYRGETDPGGVPLMSSDGTFTAPTPGTLAAGQAPAQPAEVPEALFTPVVMHTPPVDLPAGDARLQAGVYVVAAPEDDAAAPVSVTLTYRLGTAPEQATAELSPVDEDQANPLLPSYYDVVVPEEELEGISRLYYSFAAESGDAVTHSPAGGGMYNTAIYHETADVTAQALITELLPASSGGQYSYIEVYNNTDRDLLLDDHRLVDQAYNGANTFYSFAPGQVIPAGEVGVIWAQNEQSFTKDVADFNAVYGTALDDVITLDRPFAMYTGGEQERRIVLATASGDLDGRREGVVSGIRAKATYSRHQQDAVAGRSIQYGAPIDGSVEMRRIAADQAPTPGVVDPAQVPADVIALGADTVAPVIDHEGPGSVDLGPLRLQAKVTDDQDVTRVTLHYRAGDGAAKTRNFTLASMDPDLPEDTYRVTVPAAELADATSVTYRIEASDGVQSTRGDEHTVEVVHPEVEPLAFNLDDGTAVSRDAVMPELIVTEIEVFNGQGQKFVELYNSSGRDLALADYEYRYWWGTPESGLNRYPFPPEIETLPAGKTLVLSNPDMTVEDFNAYWGTDLSASQLSPTLFAGLAYDNRGIAVARAGSQEVIAAAPFTGADAVRDRSTMYRHDPLSYGDQVPYLEKWRTNQEPTPGSVDPEQVPAPVLPVLITRPADADAAVTATLDGAPVELTEDGERYVYLLDLDAVGEGEHSVSVTAESGEESSVSFVVDSSAPVIEDVTVEPGASYSGSLTIDAEVSDAVSGVDSLTVLLDGEPVSLGSTLLAGSFAEGPHELAITAVDRAGNTASQTVEFTTERNDLTLEVGDSQTDSDAATLRVDVAAEETTTAEVTFYEAHRHDVVSGSQIGAFANATDHQPPTELVPGGESELTASDLDALAEVDGEYVSTTSEDQFPYHRFEFAVAEDLAADDEVAFRWTGTTLEGRTVIVYFWHAAEERWVEAARGQGTENFELLAAARAGDVVQDGTVHVLVQDPVPGEVPGAAGDEDATFTFAWLPDTQYYSETYHYIWPTMMDYLVGPAREERNIQYVMHTGDVVDEYDVVEQWEVADEAFRTLEEAGLPYGVTAGNHDVNHETPDYSFFSEWFGRDRVAEQDVFGGDRADNRDHYDLVSVDGHDFIILYLGWKVGQETIDWANAVLEAHPDRYAIVATHEYLATDGVSYSGDGQKIWDTIVEPNGNVFLVIGGHLHGVARNEVTAGDGRKVTQILADYQAAREGGLGYMRFFEFDMAAGQVNVSTYSNHTGRPWHFGEDADTFSFDISAMLRTSEKALNTDHVQLEVFTGTEIAAVFDVAVPGEVAAEWGDLAPGGVHGWYATAAEAGGAEARSSIATVTTAGEPDEEPTPGEPGEEPTTDRPTEPGEEPTTDGPTTPGEEPTTPGPDGPDGEPGGAAGETPGGDSGAHGAQGGLPATGVTAAATVLAALFLITTGAVVLGHRRRAALGS